MGRIRKIERLQKLRESGALTDTEFEHEKAKILSEG
jgi:Short C-terminal domain